MDRVVYPLSCVFLLIGVAIASDQLSTSSVLPQVAVATSEQGASIRTVPVSESTNVTTFDVFAEDEPSDEEPDEPDDEPEDVPDKDDEEYEGEDEYEDELRAVAESHEAMSKDTRNTNVSVASVQEKPTEAKSFESHEVPVNTSDEDEASNEAITDEVMDKYDEEVAELLKYKKERNSNQRADEKSKTKRVPTVKKELSTQKEILIGGNETQANGVKELPKSLPTQEATTNEETGSRTTTDRNGSEPDKTQIFSEKSRGDVEVAVGNRYVDSDEKKKLDKRQETMLKRLISHMSAKYSSEQEQREKLQELGAQEDVLAENLLKLLAKLAEDPSRWKRVPELLAYVEKDPKSSRNSLDASKRAFESSITTSTPHPEPRKSRKKPKKKKKPKHRQTPAPSTPSVLTTTETPWQTTVQWRLVAERLFGPPWQKDDKEEEPKIRYSVASKPRIVPSIRDLIEQNQSKSSNVLNERKEDGREIAQRLLRFGKVNTHQPAHLQGHREYPGGVYERPVPEPDRVAEFDPTYQRLRYNQLSPPSREFLRRHEDDYQNDYVQPDQYPRNDPEREFAMSKTYPDYKYRPWNADERPVVPVPGMWPCRNDKPEWSGVRAANPNDEDDETKWDRLLHSWVRSWQRMQHSLDRDRAMKMYDRDQEKIWEKSKNRSELSKSKIKEKEKVVVPQITMKTWNSLTSDPATWPHKLPGAKPWPKDENGKSYNPNADLVKKLGLDKQNNVAWANDEQNKSTMMRKQKTEKDENRLVTSNDSTRDDESQDSRRYKTIGENNNFSDYKTRSGETKSWPMKPHESPQADDGNVWNRKYETGGNTLPKIQSVGAWVMAADQSTWKPYPIKPMEPVDENSRRWSGRSSDKWPNKGTWTEKMNDSWMDTWGRTSKPGNWFPKSKEDTWKSKDWLAKPNESSSWSSKIDSNSWPVKDSPSWSTKSNESWPKGNDDPKFLNNNSWAKTKEEDTWPRKSEQNGWTSKTELWQQKINDDWNYGKGGPTGTWPSKWKQFAYHRVTAMPISKPGTTADATSSKSRNAFVAVSAVSSPKSNGNEWRKNEEERNENQLQVGLERPIYTWKKDQGPGAKGNATDPLEDQLEALRQMELWTYKENNEAEKGLTQTTQTPPTNATTPPRRPDAPSDTGLLGNRQISMK